MELLVLLLFFHLILDINSQNVPQPRLLVSPEVITDSGSVLLHCEAPYSVKVSQFYFYPEEQKTNVKTSPESQLSVTGSELIRWTGRRSPGTLQIICYYSVERSGVHAPSPPSLPAPVTVLHQKPKLSFSYYDQLHEFIFICEIPDSESVTGDFSCNLYTGEKSYLKTSFLKKRRSGQAFCSFTAERKDLFNRLRSVKRSEVSCDYSLTSESTARSRMSEKYSMMPFFSTPTHPSIRTETSGRREVTTPPVPSTHLTTTRHTTMTQSTRVPPNPDLGSSSAPNKSSPLPTPSPTTKERTTSGSLLILLLSVTSVSVLLTGMVIVCACRFIWKRKAERRKKDKTHGGQGIKGSMYNMNTSSTEAPGTYSVISSVLLPSMPSEPSGDVKEDCKETGDGVYHMYCTIADTQVVTRNNASEYHLLQMH